MAAQVKLLVCITVFGCLLRSASCDNKKKIVVKVPHVVKHIHHTQFEPVHIHKIHHQKKNHHHHKQEKKKSVRKSGWESRAHEKPRLMMPSLAPQDNEDHLLDSYEYGRESFWDGGSANFQGKRRRHPDWEDSLEEPTKWSNVEVPKWMNRGQRDYGEEWVMSDEDISGLRGDLGYRGGREPSDSGRKGNGRKLSWRSNEENGWKPITDPGHWDDERVSRGKEKANAENQYTYSGETTDGESPEYRQTKERQNKKEKKKGENKPKWSKQIQEGEPISEEDVQRIIESLQLEQYQQQQIPQQQMQPQQHHQEYRFQQQNQLQQQPTVQQQLLLPHQQQVHQTVQQPVYRAQNPIVLSMLSEIQPQHISQPQPSSWSLPSQPKKPAVLPEPQQWTSHQTPPLTTHSPKMVWTGHHLQLPQTTMWHVQQHDVGSTSGLPVQVISSGYPKSINTSKPPSQPQTLASDPFRHQVLPPAGWPMNQKSQTGVKQKWEQSVQMSGRDGPASSYKVEVINYSDNKRV